MKKYLTTWRHPLFDDSEGFDPAIFPDTFVESRHLARFDTRFLGHFKNYPIYWNFLKIRFFFNFTIVVGSKSLSDVPMDINGLGSMIYTQIIRIFYYTLFPPTFYFYSIAPSFSVYFSRAFFPLYSPSFFSLFSPSFLSGLFVTSNNILHKVELNLRSF